LPEFLWKWRKEIIFSLLLAISLGLLVAQRRPDVFSQGLRQGLTFVLFPLQKLSYTSTRQTRHWVSLVASFGHLRVENATLQRQVEALTLENARLAEQAREAEALRTELGYRRRTEWVTLPAEIIGRDPASWLDRVIVNRGTADGVSRGAGVIAPQGVVGRVSEVTLTEATVMLLPDVQSSVAGVVQRSRVPGTVKGTGKRWLGMGHVSGTDDVRAGDVVATSSVSSIFPSGLLIGDVVSAAPAEGGLMLSIQINPRVNFQNLDRVLILKSEK
jgi:rod shape-determining protein MreC